MSLQTQRKNRSYSSVYKIYRRLRFIRYKKKVIRNQKHDIKKKEIQEQLENKIHLQEFKLSERLQKRIKIKAEREEASRLERELKEEFRLRKKLAKVEWKKLSFEEKSRARQARIEEKRKNKRLRKHNLRVRIWNFSQSIRSINIVTLKRKFRTFRANAPKRRRFVLISFNSTVLFLAAYFVLFIFSQIITVIAASFFHYPTIVYYYEIYFNINTEAWYSDAVKTIFAAGPLVNFVIGITFLIIYSKLREITGPFKLFFLWGFLHSVNMLFGALLVGTLFESGVGHVISWMYVMDTGKVLYSIISIFLLVISGLLVTKQFIISANTYYNEINNANRTSFIISQVFIPYLIGNTLLVIIRQPRFIFYDTFIAGTLIICILPILATYKSYNDLFFEEEEKKPGIAWIALAILALLIFFYRYVEESGIRIGG